MKVYDTDEIQCGTNEDAGLCYDAAFAYGLDIIYEE